MVAGELGCGGRSGWEGDETARELARSVERLLNRGQVTIVGWRADSGEAEWDGH